jgi:hypothetical protein
MFHFWNGLAFGGFYSAVINKSTVWKGVLWGTVLEFALVITSPRLLKITLRDELLSASIIGHVAYGWALAYCVAKSEKYTDCSTATPSRGAAHV